MALTLKQYKEHLTYNPLSGEFIWHKHPRYPSKNGTVAGGLMCNGYIKIKLHKHQVLAHRLAWLFVYEKMPSVIDHIDLCKTNNAIENLRDVNHKSNSKNRGMDKRNNSGCVGVSWCKQTNRWRAQIVLEGKSKTLGRYTDYSDAVNARKNAEILYGFYENNKRGGSL